MFHKAPKIEETAASYRDAVIRSLDSYISKTPLVKRSKELYEQRIDLATNLKRELSEMKNGDPEFTRYAVIAKLDAAIVANHELTTSAIEQSKKITYKTGRYVTVSPTDEYDSTVTHVEKEPDYTVVSGGTDYRSGKLDKKLTQTRKELTTQYFNSGNYDLNDPNRQQYIESFAKIQAKKAPPAPGKSGSGT